MSIILIIIYVVSELRQMQYSDEINKILNTKIELMDQSRMIEDRTRKQDSFLISQTEITKELISALKSKGVLLTTTADDLDSQINNLRKSFIK